MLAPHHLGRRFPHARSHRSSLHRDRSDAVPQRLARESSRSRRALPSLGCLILKDLLDDFLRVDTAHGLPASGSPTTFDHRQSRLSAAHPLSTCHIKPGERFLAFWRSSLVCAEVLVMFLWVLLAQKGMHRHVPWYYDRLRLL